jgi:two-component system, cell cycle sensor histidine kinase and response regulator CckA
LPVAVRGAEPESELVSYSEPPQGTGTVLLVEDDALVRKVAQQSLSTLGYTVMEAETGDAALEVINSGVLPDVLFSDISLPGTLDGYALACQVVEQYSGVNVLLTTGADSAKLAGSGVDAGRFALLRKPYTPATLAEAVQKLLAPRTK